MKRYIISFILLFLFSCSSVTTKQVLKEGTFYRRDMIIRVNDKAFEGMGVVESSSKYNFHVEARGEIDLFIFSSCNRDWTKEKAWNVTMKVKKGMFRKRKLVDKKREIKFDYAPIETIERTYCPVRLSGVEEKKGRHSWGFIDFKTKDMILPARLECNGEASQVEGVAVCQSRAGLTQVIYFDNEMIVESDKLKCKLPTDIGTRFEFQIPKGNCVYRFMRIKDPNLEFRLTTYGYEKILIRQVGEK